MEIKFFNTMGRRKEVFRPIKDKEVKMYTCGPTVYNYAHIGNLRTYLFEDFLRRTLEYFKFKVKHVMNITDIGHLASDADEGEDKMVKALKREGLDISKESMLKLADKYTKAFKEDIKRLNILEPSIWCKATEHIAEIIELIKRLEKNGLTYIAGGNVYFDTSKFKDYGKLANLKLENLKAGARVCVDKNKKNPYDFVLWFTHSKWGDHIMQWDSPWGPGFPGWHIECSAMSMKYLGEHFDIHCGGVDHIPVHHTNEIAQSEGATSKKWVNYWLHGEFLVMDKGKMSKSAGNFITLQTLIDKGFSPLDYRYLCLGTHYRKQLMFSWEALEGAKNSLKNLKDLVLEIKSQANSKNNLKKKDAKKYIEEFKKEIADDLNMPKALAVAWRMLKDEEVDAKKKYEVLLQFDRVLGLDLENIHEEPQEIPANILALVEKRETARKEKDFATADKIREEIKSKGYTINDTPQGPIIKRAGLENT